MDLLSIIWAFTLVYYVASRPSDITDYSSDRELKLVHVIFRHGARTPADTFPTDPFINSTMEPYGWGQLTNKGKSQLYALGSFLRDRYSSYLDTTYRTDDVYAQSTGSTRTKMSLQLVMAALYPPKGTPLEWDNKLNWHPFDLNYQPLDEDTLLLVRKSCPRYHEALENVLNKDVKGEMEKYTELMANLTKLTGMDVKTAEDVAGIYSTLKAEDDIGLKLPEWTHDYFPDKMYDLAKKSYVYNAYNSELKRLKGGVFVAKAIDDWQKKIDGKLNKKIFVYAGHDSTVVNVLSAMNVWPADEYPDYAVTTLIELSEDKSTKKLGVEVFLKNGSNVHKLTIPGCDQFCELSKLKTLLADNLPVSWEKGCVPKDENFTEPPLGGP